MIGGGWGLGSRTRIRNGDLGRNSATCPPPPWFLLFRGQTPTSQVLDSHNNGGGVPGFFCLRCTSPALLKKPYHHLFFFARKPRIKRNVINFIFAQRTLLFSQVCHSNCCTMLFFLKKPSFEHCSCLELMDCRVSIPACFASEYVGCEFLHTRLNS